MNFIPRALYPLFLCWTIQHLGACADLCALGLCDAHDPCSRREGWDGSIIVNEFKTVFDLHQTM